MMEIVRTQKEATLDPKDVISLVEAANLSERSITVISAMLDRGSLPWYEYPPDMPVRAGQRFTSRRAVQLLPKKGK